jgi:hypothetical protein
MESIVKNALHASDLLTSLAYSTGYCSVSLHDCDGELWLTTTAQH